MKHKFTLFVVVSSVVAMLLVPAAVGIVVADHSEGDPPEDPGNNATEVPGIGRPACIPPQDPGHGQPDCIPPSNPPGLGGDLPGNAPITPPGLGGDNPGNGNGNGGSGSGGTTGGDAGPSSDTSGNQTIVDGVGDTLGL